MNLFRVKICGITRIADAEAAVAAGADAVGLNFYEHSVRFLPPQRRAEILQTIPAGVLKVGVFVNASLDEVRRTLDELPLDMVQLHGDEPPAFLAGLSGHFLLRAFRCRDVGLEPVSRYLAQCRQLDCMPDAVLIDAYQPGQYGGTGKVVEIASLARQRDQLREIPWVLAGGLNPQNVTAAIIAVRPWAVDTASGVESVAGEKIRPKWKPSSPARRLESGGT